MGVIDEELRRFGRLLHYAGLLATVLCAAAGYSFVHAPSIDAVANNFARIEELKLSIQNAPIIREQHLKVTKKLDEVRTRIADVQARVPRDADAGGFLKQVTQLAIAEKLAIKDFTPEKPEIRGGYTEMQIKL
jgi:Tfp pilus assembly protein PilO